MIFDKNRKTEKSVVGQVNWTWISAAGLAGGFSFTFHLMESWLRNLPARRTLIQMGG